MRRAPRSAARARCSSYAKKRAMRARRRARDRTAHHLHPRADRRLCRGIRRPQSDPPRRRVRAVSRPARRDRPRHAADGYRRDSRCRGRRRSGPSTAAFRSLCRDGRAGRHGDVSRPAERPEQARPERAQPAWRGRADESCRRVRRAPSPLRGEGSGERGVTLEFSLTSEQEEIRKLAHQFAEREIRPVAAHFDETEEFPYEVVKKAHRLGLSPAAFIPEEYGGQGLDFLTELILNEELSWGCAGIAVCIQSMALAMAGIRASGTEEQEKRWLPKFTDPDRLVLEDCHIPLDHRLGGEPDADNAGPGALGALMTLEATRPGVAAGALGIARAAYEFALEYAQDRKQFGKPLWQHEAVGFKLADMAMRIDAARLLIWRAGWMANQGRPFERAEGSMAKCFAADVAMDVTTDAIQVLGGYG